MGAHATRRLVRAVPVVTLVMSFAAMARAQTPTSTAAADNPVLGTWTLVVDKSRYNPGPPPQSQTRTYEVQPNGMKTTIRTVLADGETTVVSYTANYDSIEYHVSGSATADGIKLTQVDPHTAEAKLMHAGRIVGTARRVVSPDGGTMTITLRDVRGSIQNVAFYEKRQGS
jgi:hypothetical protein